MEDKDRDSIIRACERGTDYYAIPPLGNRINFHSQQIRSLNLVKAVHARGEGAFEPGRVNTVAVIGAGLSGITAAIGLVCKGHEVHIYDVFDRPLVRQASASHRMLHPTMNFWPDGKSKLSATTALPFFDWIQGQCDSVISDLQEQWKKHSTAYEDKLIEHFGIEVDGVVPAGAGGYRLRLKGRGNSEDLYHAVFIAVGFSEETVHSDFPTPSYWVPDSLDRDVDDASMLNKVISGAGDGGLIEALRCLYKFKKGLLAFHVAEALEETEIEPLISNAEKILARPGTDLAVVKQKYDEAIGRFLTAKRCDFGSKKELSEDSTNCEDPSCSCRLVDAFEMIRTAERRKAHVTLIDRSCSQIILSRAAPAHKFLALLAEYGGRLSFKTGKLAKDSESGAPTVLVDIAGKSEPRKELLPTDSTIYVRHGAKTCFGRVLQIEEKNVFGEGHSWMSEINVIPLFSDTDFADPKGLLVPANMQERAKKRKDVAETALVQLANTPGARVVSIDGDERTGKSIKYFYAGPIVTFGLSSGELFGVPIEYEGPLERGSKSVPKSKQE